MVGVDRLPRRVILVEPHRVREARAGFLQQLGKTRADEIAFAPVLRQPMVRKAGVAADALVEAARVIDRFDPGQEHPVAGLHAGGVVDVGAGNGESADGFRFVCHQVYLSSLTPASRATGAQRSISSSRSFLNSVV